jgi:ATP-binding cassette subfamily B protein
VVAAMQYWQSVRQRAEDGFRLLRLLLHGGRRIVTVLAALQLIRAIIPTALALSVGRLIGALFAAQTTTQQVVAAATVAGLFLVDQIVWLLIVPIRTIVAKRIDGRLRARIRAIAAGVSGLDVLENEQFQDRVARAVDAGRSGWDRERSAGNACVGQLELMLRIVSALIATTLLATFSVPIAVGLLVLALTMRAMARRRWMVTIGKLDAETAGHRYEYYLVEQAVYGAHQEVRLFGLSDWFAGRFRAAISRTYGPPWRDMLLTARQSWLPFLLFLLGYTTVLTFPGLAALHGELDAAQLATYLYAGFAVFAMNAMGMETYDIEYGIGAVKAAEELEKLHGRSIAPVTASGKASAPTVRFDDVHFAYPGSDRPVLDGLSLTIHSGQTIAIVGENGVGKTTLVKLLAGLYRPQSGTITVDGVAPHEKRPRLAVLFQDFVRYPATVRENVTWAAPGSASNDDAVLEALRLAGANEIAADSGQETSLDTLLWREGTAGTELSGGQWQRVALARVLHAVATGRRLLVLDEPTASLDVRAEAEFHERVVSQVADTTTILISHRMSTVRPADRIVLLRDGRVAEDGTHDELLALGGQYATFFTTQAAAFAAGPSQVEES